MADAVGKERKTGIMKKFIALFLCATLLFLLSACGSEKEKIVIALDWTPNTNHTGMYVAQEKGYFKQAGLNVEIVYIEGDATDQLCAAGTVQFAVSAQDTLAPAFTGTEPLGITAVAALLQHNTSGIISRAGEGIDRPRGMSGKTYSTWNSPVEQAIIRQVVTEDNGDYSSINMIPNNISDEPGALEAKETDAIWVFYGWAAVGAGLRNIPCDFFFFSDLDPVFDYYTPILIGNNEYLESHPDETRALLSALAKGYEYAIQNPDEAADILIDSDSTGSLKGSEDLVRASQNWMTTQYRAELPAEQWGYIDSLRWNDFYSWLYAQQLIDEPIPYDAGYTNDYLPMSSDEPGSTAAGGALQ